MRVTADEIAWLAVVYRRAQEIAEHHDPKRQHRSRLANKMDVIARLAGEAYFEATGKLAGGR